MANSFLDVNYWRNDFAVTDGDLERLEGVLRKAGEPLWATRLLRHVIEYKLARDSRAMDPLERAKSLQAASRFLGEATVYHPTGHYQVGQLLYVARRLRGGDWQIGCGHVIRVDRSQREAVVEIEIAGEPKPWMFVCDLPASHLWVQRHASPLSGKEQTADDVLEPFGAELLPHLLGRLSEDARFVNWGDRWWLSDAVCTVPDEAMEQLQAVLLRAAGPLPISELLGRLGDGWPDTPANRFSLNRALAADSDRFENAGTEAEPHWRALIPAHLIRLADGSWFDSSLPPDALWAAHGALFARPLPEELRDHADLVEIYDRWLLRPLLIAFDAEDLQILHAYLEEACEARGDVDLLDLLGKKPQDDDWLRWRFSLAWALHEADEGLGIEFVGAGEAWRWALRVAPTVRPERFRPIPGRDGLPVAVVLVPAQEVEQELRLAEAEEPSPEPEPWEPAAHEWPYTLTYYDWQHGILPYTGDAQAIISPLAKDQARALLYVTVPQVLDEAFPVTLYRHERTPWLHSEGLRQLCQGFHLVPGARIRLLRTETSDRFTLLYTPAAEQTCRVLMFEPGSLRPHIQEVTFACEVDPDMLLAESRFTDVAALDRLYRRDRRTAPKVLADIFEVIGEYNEEEDLYRARFRDLYPLLCVTKPYARGYVQQILARSRNFPWFYPDESRAGDWYVYDCNVVLQRDRTGARRPRKPISQVVAGPAPTVKPAAEAESAEESPELWPAIEKLAGQELHTLAERQPFTIERVTDQAVHFRVASSGRRYQVRRSEVETAWQTLRERGQLAQAALRAELNLAMPVYIAALLAALPGITHTTGPVVLHYQAEAAQPEPSPAVDDETPGEDEFQQIRDLVLTSLAGQTIHTLTGSPNRIVEADDRGLTVATESGEDRIPWQWIEEVYDALRELGTIERKDVQEGPHRTQGGFRSAFIFGLLSRFAHVEGRVKPRSALIYRGPVERVLLRDDVQLRPPAPAQEEKATDEHTTDRKATSQRRQTSQKECVVPILQALEEMGGSGHITVVTDRVGELLSGRLIGRDFEQLTTRNQIRWRNTVGWAREKMKREGLLADDSPWGIWEITEQGRAYLRDHAEEIATLQNLASDEPHSSPNTLKALPIRSIDFTTPAVDRQRYVDRGRTLYDQFRTKNDYASLRAFVAQQLEARRTDVVHDLLAHLAERMIEMHKEKQEHQRTFRLDLGGYLDEKQMKRLNRLYTPKRPPAEGAKNYMQRLRRYEEAVQLATAQLGPLAGETLDLEDFWRLTQTQWQWVLRQNLGNVAGMSSLVGIYEQYRQRLAPLVRTIQRTDWLIDQVGYQLYGLTEEEIAIAEGKA